MVAGLVRFEAVDVVAGLWKRQAATSFAYLTG